MSELTPLEVCVTVSRAADVATREHARAVAHAAGLPFVKRDEARGIAIVVEKAGAHLVLGERSMTSHPGMGLVRLRRLFKQTTDRELLYEVAQLRESDRVLDATFGFGQDALMLAHAVGASGEVVALEASPALAALSLAGMRHWPEPAKSVVPRIKLRVGDHRVVLPELESRSFDVVYLDPMFRDAQSAAPDFALLRLLADPRPLEAETIRHAQRIARRLVVVKDAWPGRELERLGLRVEHEICHGSAVVVFGTAPAL